MLSFSGTVDPICGAQPHWRGIKYGVSVSGSTNRGLHAVSYQRGIKSFIEQLMTGLYFANNLSLISDACPSLQGMEAHCI